MLVALVLLAAASPVREVKALYLELQFERCLERAAQLGAGELDEPSRGALALYRGLCRYGLGDLGAAVSDFDEAMRRSPELEAPAGTSPKVLVELDAARARARARAPEPLLPAPVAEAPPAAVPAPPVVAKTEPRLRPLVWSLAAAAAVTAGVSAFLGTQAQANAEAGNRAEFTYDADRLIARAHGLETATNVGWGLAALFAAGALLVWIFDR
ncbi:MAG: hypothetical protein IPJ65_05830 [Archangiaceae bacterium]|nr:hypothetical protein [Archangiaceae bacterium]